MTDTATKLDEAETALHQLLLGKQIVRLVHGDTETSYTAASIPALRAYIAELKGLLGQTGRTSARRVVFG